MKTTRTIAPLTVLAVLAACGSTEQWENNKKDLGIAVERLGSGELKEVEKRMHALLNATASREDFELQQFYAAYVLAQLHTAASLDAPFMMETTTAGGGRGLGRRDDRGGGGRTRPSPQGHLMAAVYYASTAQDLYGAAKRAAPKYEGVTLLPDELATLGVDNADANLSVVLASSLSRMGFDGRVRGILDESPPELLTLDGCMAALDEYQVSSRLRSWVARMMFEYLREDNEEEAFRFGVAAVEGGERFELKLPDVEIDAIEDWITDGASVTFVCPDSRTPYIRGERRSPVSGKPHIEYIAVEKE